MFRTLFTMACCAVALSQAQASTVITNSTASTVSGAAWRGLQFSFADTANSRLTTAGGLASLGQFVSLNSLSFTNVTTGGGNWATPSRIMILLDSANKIIAWSDTVDISTTNSSPTFTFGSAPTLDTTATYKIAFSDSGRVNNIAGGLAAGNTFLWTAQAGDGASGAGTTTEIRANGPGSLAQYGNTTNSASLAGIGYNATTSPTADGTNSFTYKVNFNVTPVPEPSAAAFGLLSLSGLLLRRRRK